MNTSVDASVAAGVHAAIAAYAHALDAGRTDDIVGLFCPDGVAEIVGSGTFEGHDAIRAAYAGWVPEQPQLHLVANTVITSWTENDATATSAVAFLHRAESGWAVRLVGRYDDTLHRHDDGWRFQRRVTTFVP
jgi:ketosteroid isomerase-like protein